MLWLERRKFLNENVNLRGQTELFSFPSLWLRSILLYQGIILLLVRRSSLSLSLVLCIFNSLVLGGLLSVFFGQFGSFFYVPLDIRLTTFFLCLELFVVQNFLLISFLFRFFLLFFRSPLQQQILSCIFSCSLSLSLVFCIFNNLVPGGLLSLSFGQVGSFFYVPLDIRLTPIFLSLESLLVQNPLSSSIWFRFRPLRFRSLLQFSIPLGVSCSSLSLRLVLCIFDNLVEGGLLIVFFDHVEKLLSIPLNVGLATVLFCLELLVVQSLLSFGICRGFLLLGFDPLLQFFIPSLIFSSAFPLSLVFFIFDDLGLGILDFLVLDHGCNSHVVHLFVLPPLVLLRLQLLSGKLFGLFQGIGGIRSLLCGLFLESFVRCPCFIESLDDAFVLDLHLLVGCTGFGELGVTDWDFLLEIRDGLGSLFCIGGSFGLGFSCGFVRNSNIILVPCRCLGQGCFTLFEQCLERSVARLERVVVVDCGVIFYLNVGVLGLLGRSGCFWLVSLLFQVFDLLTVFF